VCANVSVCRLPFCVLFWCRIMVIRIEADYKQHVEEEALR